MDTSCIVCQAPTEDGTYFRTHGNYGSTVFDPMDGSYLDILICNPCLAERARHAACGRDRRPVVCEGVQVGWARTPGREAVTFNPEVMGDHDVEDILVVEPEELGTPVPTVEWFRGV